MDPNPNKFPILSYVMSRIPQLGTTTTKHPSYSDFDDIDIEQPRPRSSSASPCSSTTPNPFPESELTTQMPHLNNPEIMSAMQSAVSNVSQTRSILKTLGDRPDHETVDSAKSKILEIEANLVKQLEEIVLESKKPNEIDLEKEKEIRQVAEKEKIIYKAVVQLDEMHESYEKLLRDAEERLMKIYRSAAASGGKAVVVEDQVVEVVNEEVIRILQEAEAGKVVERVELSGRELRFLPEAFGKLRGLVHLDLSSNELQVIPDSIAGLENLEELNLSTNLLESLPDSIGLLLNLKFLNVSSNKLKALPDSISRCRSLVELDASYNNLGYLPTNIGHELVNLQKLLVNLNKIRSLPTSVCEMKSLRHLDVHFNELRGLPHAIGLLTNLEILDLSSNFSDLTELPETFGDLINLRELDLSNNQIHALPDTFGRLDNLTKLNLDQNPLVIPPMEIVNEGVEAVKVFMAKRWLDILLEEERKCQLQANGEAQTGWLTRSTSWLNNWATGYLGAGEKSPRDPYLDQQL